MHILKLWRSLNHFSISVALQFQYYVIAVYETKKRVCVCVCVCVRACVRACMCVCVCVCV
jgi:hypothetical protein